MKVTGGVDKTAKTIWEIDGQVTGLVSGRYLPGNRSNSDGVDAVGADGGSHIATKTNNPTYSSLDLDYAAEVVGGRCVKWIFGVGADDTIDHNGTHIFGV